MSSHSSRTRPRRLAALGVALGLLTTAIALPAVAHDELVASDPAAGSTIEQLPGEITLTFSGVLIDEAGANRVSVTDAAGTELAEGEPVLDGTEVTQSLAGSSQGPITVVWRVVSSDGHPVSGEYSFVAGDADAAPATPTADDAASAEGTEDEGLPAGLWIGIAVALLAAVVAVVVAVVAASRRRTED